MDAIEEVTRGLRKLKKERDDEPIDDSKKLTIARDIDELKSQHATVLNSVYIPQKVAYILSIIGAGLVVLILYKTFPHLPKLHIPYLGVFISGPSFWLVLFLSGVWPPSLAQPRCFC
jgi:hypothetical protein